jgi:Sec-independent protein translocase protein TatA
LEQEGKKKVALKVGSFSIKQLRLEKLYNIYFGMSPREQTFALIGAAIVLVLVVVLPVVVASSRISRLENDMAQGKRQFRDVIRAIESFNERKAELSKLQQTLAGGFDSSLSTTIESIAEKNNMKDQIDSLKAKSASPSDLFEESSVDVRLKRVELKPLIDFLYAIENDPEKMLRVKTLSIKPRFDEKKQLDITLTVSTYRFLEGAAEGL